MANPEAALYQGTKERRLLNRKNVGTGIEATGVIVTSVELFRWNIPLALVGGAIWLIGHWVRNYNKDSRVQHPLAA